MNNWIPCAERLPDDYGIYLVTLYGLECNDTDFCKYNPDTQQFSWDAVCDDVIAWMPLPDPYSPDSSDNSHDFSNACELCVHKNVSCTGCMTADRWEPKL